MHGEGHPQIRAADRCRAAEAVAGDANDDKRLSVQRDRLADQFPAAAESALPQPIREYGHRMRTELLILNGKKGSTGGNRRAQEVEVVAAHNLREQLFGFTFSRERQRCELRQRHAAEDRVLIAQVLEVRTRGAVELHGSAVADFSGPDNHKTPDVLDRHWMQQDRIDEREHGGVRADAEC